MKDFKDFINKNTEFGEWELSPVEQDFYTMCKQINYIDMDSIIPIHRDIFNISGNVEYENKNICFRTFAELEDEEEGWFGLFAFSPNNTDEWVCLLVDDYLVIADILYNFRAVLDEEDIKDFFEHESKDGLSLKDGFYYLLEKEIYDKRGWE